ncbi:porin family protein [Alistipes sp.]|uniref:porin family protein n=1 Tax=Alistipes sp. TaxID=1872444 RepID=UPI003AB4FF20
MKKAFLILAAILLATAVSAQNHEKNILGVRAGLNLSSYSISESGVSLSTDSRASFHVAVVDQILLCNRLPFYLETGLAFSSRGGKVSGVSFRPSYLQIPVLVNYHFNIKDIVTIQPFAGLYYGFGIGGKVKAGGEKGDIFGDEGGLKRSDLGVRLGAGVVWNRIYFGLGYDIGCLDLVKDNDSEGKMRNNCFSISVGYNF